MTVSIREYREDDAAGVRACVVELQEFERHIDSRLRRGEDMADGYFDGMLRRCGEATGRIFVADVDGDVVGFVAVLAHEPFTQLDDPPGTFGFVSDLVVRATHRHQGIGRQLLERAETFARDAGAKELRICVLAQNTVARHLYLSAAFAPHQEILAKRL